MYSTQNIDRYPEVRKKRRLYTNSTKTSKEIKTQYPEEMSQEKSHIRARKYSATDKFSDDEKMRHSRLVRRSKLQRYDVSSCIHVVQYVTGLRRSCERETGY